MTTLFQVWVLNNWVELLGAVLGILYIFLSIKQNILTWPVGFFTSLLYVIVRIPKKLKERLTKSQIELSLAKWFKEKSNLKTIQVSDPIYFDGEADRIDIALFIGGFNLSSVLISMEKKANPIKNQILKQGLIKKKEWEEIKKTINNQ